MIVFDVVLHGRIQETLRPANQRHREIYWFIVDRIPSLKQKYGLDMTICRRVVQE
ncbi:MAG: hypothetical protein K0R28_4747 [Paenibacillus sp.]|nr:hypothetical protein [Paenibacillus sp.]